MSRMIGRTNSDSHTEMGAAWADSVLRQQRSEKPGAGADDDDAGEDDGSAPKEGRDDHLKEDQKPIRDLASKPSFLSAA